MQQGKIVVGLDIGTTKICVMVGTKNEFGKLEILGMGKAKSEGVIRGMVHNIDKTVNAINRALVQAEEQSGIDIGEVNVGIAGQHIKSMSRRGSLIREDADGEVTAEDVGRLTNDMFKIVTSPGNEIIHVMPQEFWVDYGDPIKDPVGMVGVRLDADFHIITANTGAILNINKCVKRSRGMSEKELEICEMNLEPLASSMSVLSEEEKEAGVVLVDIGGGTTDVAIFYEGIIRHTAVIPFGGNIITSDIKEGLTILNDDAEKIKIKYGRAIAEEASTRDVIAIPGLRNRPAKEIAVKNLAYIIEARMQEIIELVHTEILCSGCEDKLGAGLVVTGGGSQLASVQQLFEYMTGVHTRVGYPNEHLGKSKVEEIKSPMYATAVGLVLSGFTSVDERDKKFSEFQSPVAGNKVVKRDNGKFFFKKIQNKLKGLLIDDFKDEKDY